MFSCDQFSLVVEESTCSSITHWCVAVSGGDGGYFIESYAAQLPITCLEITTDVLRCDGECTYPCITLSKVFYDE